MTTIQNLTNCLIKFNAERFSIVNLENHFSQFENNAARDGRLADIELVIDVIKIYLNEHTQEARFGGEK